MADQGPSVRKVASDLREMLTGLLGLASGDELAEDALKREKDYRTVKFGPEIRRARLYTEFYIEGEKIAFEALGARSCSVNSAAFSAQRGTQLYNLACSLTWFATETSPLGPVRIFQDPRIENLGWIYLRRNEADSGKRDVSVFQLPALSYFNQHLIFHIGDRWLYYPRAWQVVASITRWPPEHHQYHHLEDKTPVFDLITKEPNVAIKGISTISIEGPLNSDEEAQIVAACEHEIEEFRKLPGTIMSPDDLTPAQQEEVRAEE